MLFSKLMFNYSTFSYTSYDHYLIPLCFTCIMMTLHYRTTLLQILNLTEVVLSWHIIALPRFSSRSRTSLLSRRTTLLILSSSSRRSLGDFLVSEVFVKNVVFVDADVVLFVILVGDGFFALVVRGYGVVVVDGRLLLFVFFIVVYDFRRGFAFRGRGGGFGAASLLCWSCRGENEVLAFEFVIESEAADNVLSGQYEREGSRYWRMRSGNVRIKPTRCIFVVLLFASADVFGVGLVIPKDRTYVSGIH